MTSDWIRRRLLLAGTTFIAACTVLGVGWLFLANASGAALLWLGPGPRLEPQVEARLKPTGHTPAYAGVNPEEVASMYLQPIEPLKRWRIVRVRAANAFPLWASVWDDDPVYSLEVDLEVEQAGGGRSQLRWATWRYGLVVGPVVVSYGDGPPGELRHLPEAVSP